MKWNSEWKQRTNRYNFLFEGMFGHVEGDCGRFDKEKQEKTASNFSSNHDDSFVYEIQTEKEYVHRLKLQREKIEALYCKYDVLLGDLKAKELLIKEKDRKIGELEARLKSLLQANEQHSLSKQQVLGIKSENTLLLSSLSQLEEQYNSLHNRLKAKESSATQRHVELEAVVQELMAKLKTVSKKLIDKEQEIADQAKEASNRLETQQLEAGKEKTQLLEDISALRNELLRQDEESNILYSENDCLKQRVKELQNELAVCLQRSEDKLEKSSNERKAQIRVIKSELSNSLQINDSLQRKLSKLKEQIAGKTLEITTLKTRLEEQDKNSNEGLFVLRHQQTQEKTALKEQLLYCENHISKLQRKLLDSLKREKEQEEALRKYELCLSAKKGLREVEREEIERINMLLSMSH